MDTKSVLILRPHKNDPGGVANYYNLVNKYFCSNQISIRQFYVGKENGNDWFGDKLIKTIKDFFYLRALFQQFDLIVFNPSLDIKAILRDGMSHFIAKYFYRKKTMVFFRGWTPSIENLITKNGQTIFKIIFNANIICVLSKQIKTALTNWGFNPKRIIIETTTFEEGQNQKELDPNKIIFLSRFVKGKGCLHAIKAVEELISEFSSIQLFMAGAGPLMNELTSYVREHNLCNHVKFTGYISGKNKFDILSKCGIMLYPTFYGEGMPNSLLEAMGMGMVPVTRPVGGIADIIVDGKNGFLVQSSDPKIFASKIRYLLKNRLKWQSMSKISLREAKEKFEVRNVVKRLEKIYFKSIQTIC